MPDEIKSRDNEKVKYACHIAAQSAFRQAEKKFFAEGKKLCFDLARFFAADMVFFTEKFADANPAVHSLPGSHFLISEPVEQKLSETRAPQGLYALYEMPETTLSSVDFTQGALFCEGVQNPANIGAMVRSAAAFGLGGVVLLPGCADPYAPKTLRASMGTVGHIPVVADVTLAQAGQAAKSAGAIIYAAALQEAVPLGQQSLEGPFALLVGSEGQGLSPAALAMADSNVCIPMQREVESLNAAVAASVLMSYFSQGR